MPAGEPRPPAIAVRVPMLTQCLRLACLIVAALVAAQWPAAASAQGERQGRGFLWEATRGNERVLLLGAIHVGRPEFAMTAADLRRLMQAEVIAFEANVFDAQASLAATQRWAMYGDGSRGLEADVDKDTLVRIEKIIARTGAFPVCCRMKPWMVANTLVVLEAIGAGFSPAYGSEAQLYQLAMSTERPIVEIEGLGEQLRLFDEAAKSTQVEHLRKTLDDIESGSARAEIERLVGAWERGDEAAMERLLDQMTRGESAAQRFVSEQIIGGRHPKMLAAIERYAGSGRRHLVVIGALHYFGPHGLLQGLRERGFAVERLQ
jgi:uncharacterized protein YbaP (TraB family)